ncbi:hypothetical protein [Bailinhaonella thermotolerans]|uniref:Uncharacterized protein n=1 Tax=Bailinhaonella thermotolerans TaxID=1070861 RepID=A0A3A4BGT3_9ACTN|nr:hypothetical protein [Bailinhaonella thermotolerans]RJL33952.1 hypothetical protein D5H75_05300 [Bailinhaonella thermotolerans]
MGIEELLRRQEELRAEAEAVFEGLGLAERLAPFGEVVRVGSAALGLMVWRDLDLTVVCPELDVAAVARAGAAIAAHPWTRRVDFRNDTGEWNTDPAYPDGIYLGVGCRGPAGEEWRLDIWFVDEPERQPDLAHVRELPPRLTPEARAAILLIKDEWARRPEYGQAVRSVDVYTAVLDHGVRTPAGFERWLRDRPPAGG